ncbi:MAG: hypothetical protein MUO52_12370 [Desulfobacterales bacterium]|nr:hypothetical protein [Desulfobacterales bacterium]
MPNCGILSSVDIRMTGEIETASRDMFSEIYAKGVTQGVRAFFEFS